MSKNFVSVSGISNRKELEEIGKIYRDEKLKFNLAIGYQVSGLSINRGTRNPRQPFFSDLGELCRSTEEIGFIPAVHYYAKSNDGVKEDIEKIALQPGVDAYCSLIQFNTLPLPLSILRDTKDYGFEIIFKVAVSNKQSPGGGYKVWKGEGVEDVNEGDASVLVRQVEDRLSYIDYAMFGPRDGEKLRMAFDDESMAVRFGNEITGNEQLVDVNIVYAGGIKPGNVQRIAGRLDSFFSGRFCIDTESGVRTNNQLDLGLVREYLINSGSVFR